MPMLDNARHERFAQELAHGKSATEAYSAAGYKPHQQNASRMMSNDVVQKRVAELKSRVVEAVLLTKEWIIEQLIENAQLAKANDDFAPANKAIELLGKELGMFIERKEVGKPGAFDELSLEQKRERAIAIAKQLGLDRIGPTAGSA